MIKILMCVIPLLWSFGSTLDQEHEFHFERRFKLGKIAPIDSINSTRRYGRFS